MHQKAKVYQNYILNAYTKFHENSLRPEGVIAPVRKRGVIIEQFLQENRNNFNYLKKYFKLYTY